jgi:LAO/AO transport system kinase
VSFQNIDELISGIFSGQIPAIARSISLLEDGSPQARQVIKAVHPRAGKSWIVGITGPPGAGKSTLVDGLAGNFRAAGHKVGIIAVDPSSAFSGGAVLGDRVRMQRHSGDPGVFIRSMATRGHFGGLSRAASDAADVLDAAGFDIILMETVGVGQDEVEVIRAADCVLVVLVPGLGDDIQAIKAGLLEIADLYVLNKADREGVDRLESEISTMLALGGEHGTERPPVIRTIAVKGEGLEPLIQGITRHRASAGASGAAVSRRRDRSRWRLVDLIRERVLRWASEETSGDGALQAAALRIYERSEDPYEAADSILDAFASRLGRNKS